MFTSFPETSNKNLKHRSIFNAVSNSRLWKSRIKKKSVIYILNLRAEIFYWVYQAIKNFFFLKKNTMAIVCCRSLLHRYAGKLKLHTLVTVRNIYSEGNAFSNPLFLSVKSVSLESRYKRGPSQILAFLIRQVCWLTLKNCSAS